MDEEWGKRPVSEWVAAETGVPKHPEETIREYFRRLGTKSDVDQEDLDVIVQIIEQSIFSPETLNENEREQLRVFVSDLSDTIEAPKQPMKESEVGPDEQEATSGPSDGTGRESESNLHQHPQNDTAVQEPTPPSTLATRVSRNESTLVPTRPPTYKPLNGGRPFDSLIRWVERQSLYPVGLGSAAAFLLWMIWLGMPKRTTTHPGFPDSIYDGLHYLRMAQGNPIPGAPWRYRILTPKLVSILPGTEQTGFMIVTFVSLATTPILLYYLAREYEFSRPLSATGGLMFLTLHTAVNRNIENFWLVDPLAFVFVTAAIILAKRDHYLAFSAILCVGLLAKESILFAAPLIYTLNASVLFDREQIKKTLIAGIAPVLVLMVVRTSIETTNKYSLTGQALEIVPQRINTFDSFALQQYTILSHNLLLVLPLAGIRRNLDVFVRYSPFIAGVYAQILFATNTQRLLVLAFPAMTIFALNGLVGLREKVKVMSGPMIDERLFLALPSGLILLEVVLLEEVSKRAATSRWIQFGVAAVILMGIIILASSDEFQRSRKRATE